MPIQDMSEQDERRYRDLGMHLFEAWCRWQRFNAKEEKMRQAARMLLMKLRARELAPEDLGEFWAVWASAPDRYNSAGEKDVFLARWNLPKGWRVQ
jgi:hypothetical protein